MDLSTDLISEMTVIQGRQERRNGQIGKNTISFHSVRTIRLLLQYAIDCDNRLIGIKSDNTFSPVMDLSLALESLIESRRTFHVL